MSINETKRGIQTLDNGTTFGLSDQHLVYARDLKALADSHDELLEACKAVRDLATNRDELIAAAIDNAEQLEEAEKR